MYFFMDSLMFFHESISISIIFFVYIIKTPNQIQSLVKNGIFFAPLKKIVVKPIEISIYLFGL